MKRVGIGVCAGCGAEAVYPNLVDDPRIPSVPPSTFDSDSWEWHPCPNRSLGKVKLVRYDPVREQGGVVPVAWRFQGGWATRHIPNHPVRGVVAMVTPYTDDEVPTELVFTLQRYGEMDALSRQSSGRNLTKSDILPRDQLVLDGTKLAGVFTRGPMSMTFDDPDQFRAASLFAVPVDAQLFCWSEVVILGEVASLAAANNAVTAGTMARFNKAIGRLQRRLSE